LRPFSKVGVLTPAYAEHGHSWAKAGHTVVELLESTIDSQIDQLDVLIIINPNNPTAQRFNQEQLLVWHQRLQQRGGWLIVDEAFIDATPEDSLASHPVMEGLIILRSVGKFFGLAGIRSGFILGIDTLLDTLREYLGPWAVSNPSRYITAAALADTQWQDETRCHLKKQAARLALLLTHYGLQPDGQTDLFMWIKSMDAKAIHQKLAEQGVLTRLFVQPLSLRFGLPRDEGQWVHLEKALHHL
jgi:cobalamin biosynthetic protein CobC